jgi:hypothetical protein
MWELHTPFQATSKKECVNIHNSPRIKQNAIKKFINMDQKKH